ncbi:ATP-grasp domain-containing protein [Faecalimonas sp.]
MFYNDLKGKKLLVLGGLKKASDIVLRAQKMGAYVYVADYDENSPAKLVADEAVMLNAINVDEIVDFCKENAIDGITTGFVDILLKPCYEACKRLNLPCYTTEEMIDVSTDKKSFKKMCKKYDLPIPITYPVTKDNYREMASELSYPVFVKPLDGSGSRGASVCRNTAEYIGQVEKALSFSKRKEVVVEEYLEGREFILDYILVNGKAYLLSMFDRMVCPDRPSAINHANLLMAPSSKIDSYIEQINPKVVDMFKDMGFKNGLIFLQGYTNGDKITFFEMGCRLGGTFPETDEYFLKVNPMDMLINFALSGEMLSEEGCKQFNAKFNGKGGVVNLLVKENGNSIAEIKGIDEVCEMKSVQHCIRNMQVGDSFKVGNITDKPVAIFYIAADSFEEFVYTVNAIYNKVKVVDDDGNSMLRPVYKSEWI